MKTDLLDPEKYIDVLYLGKFIEMVASVMEKGYGEVVYRVVIQDGKPKTLHLTQTQTVKAEEALIDNIMKKE